MTPTIPPPAPISGVIFDFHGTLVDVGSDDPAGWVKAALDRLDRRGQPVALDPEQIAGLSAHLHRIWEHAATFDPHSDRDLSSARHREVFAQAVALHSGLPAPLVSALYAVMADQWVSFADTAPVLRELSRRGIRIVVLSNIGLDIRPCLKRAGVADLIDGVVLSFEVGVVKPQPAIFERALELLKVPAVEALMVGDSWRDDVGGAQLGIRTLILPRTTGPVHGLGAVLRLVGEA